MQKSKENAKLNDLSEDEILKIFRDYTPLLKKASMQNHLRSVREDAASSAKVALLKAIRQYDKNRGVPFAGYAKKIVYGDMWTFFKKERRKWTHEYIPQYVNEEGENDFFETVAGKDNTLPKIDEYTSLHMALQKLSKTERLLLKSLYLDELTQSEIAKTHGVTQQAIAKQKKRILAKLRQILS